MSDAVITKETTTARIAADLQRLWNSSRAAKVAMGLLVALVLLAVFGPLLAPYGVNEQDLSNRLTAPVGFGGTWSHPLGTDFLGRDVMSRLLHGARNSLIVATSVVLLSGALGTVLGTLAGYRRGIWEIVVMRWVDVWVAIPGLIVALVVLGFIGSTKWGIVLVLTAVYWMVYAQLTRNVVLSLSSSQYVEAARICGTRRWRIMTRHILPNLVPAVSVLAILEFAKVLIAEATLSFLGFGIQPPEASWGLDIALGRQYILSAWWLVTVPGVVLTATVLAVHNVGEWLQELEGATAVDIDEGPQL